MLFQNYIKYTKIDLTMDKEKGKLRLINNNRNKKSKTNKKALRYFSLCMKGTNLQF
jgi:hypothetical protein